MKQYVDHCPFLGNNRGIVSSVANSDQEKIAEKCPFLKGVKRTSVIKQVAPQIKEDTIIEGRLKHFFSLMLHTPGP